LSKVRFSNGALNPIATGSGYKGFDYFENPSHDQASLDLYYTNKTKADFDNMKTQLTSLFSFTFIETATSYSWEAEAVYNSEYTCHIAVLKINYNGFPKGTMCFF
jgi:hypothetical protein